MRFNTHGNLSGKHATLSPSDYHWLNYTPDKLDRVFFARQQAQRGTELHAFAHEAIRLRVKLPDGPQTLNAYVNDAIGYRMTPEVLLYYSDHCFGTADCVGFSNNTLRVHDLKTGVNEASFNQLMIYVALFCLEYRFRPSEINIEMRIYQNDGVRVLVPELDDIFHVIDKIRTFDQRLRYLSEEAAS